MSNILLVEPAYRSKFPPLGLMRISTYHKEKGDTITFVRGKVSEIRDTQWNRVYVSSLFTYELPRTVDTINYYLPSVQNPETDVYVGGIGATLLPSYIRERTSCKVVEGQISTENMLGVGTPPIATYIPDYTLIDSVDYKYQPENAYFFRVTVGCIRKCAFCAVPVLEPSFGYSCDLTEQINNVIQRFGERRDMVLMDNNMLAIDNFVDVVAKIRDAGFSRGAKHKNQKRIVDFNQGIDARLITPEIAQLLSTINLEPVRLAFDHNGVEKQYRRAVKSLAEVGFVRFTNYVMFNFNDTPASLYYRLSVNAELSQKHNIQITGFPMRYIPIQDVSRRYISKGWHWRYLRGIQCILNATHGVVSPNPVFFEGAFGKTLDEFLEILSMPDNYIIYRKQFRQKALDWRDAYRRLSDNDREEFLVLLEKLNISRSREQDIRENKKFANLLDHYYKTKFANN